MRSGCGQREMLRVVDREKVEIHIGNNVSGGWCCRRRIDRPVAAAKHRQYEQADEKKTIGKNSMVHKDSLSAATNMLRQTNAIFPKPGKWRAGRPRPAGRARRPSLHRMSRAHSHVMSGRHAATNFDESTVHFLLGT